MSRLNKVWKITNQLRILFVVDFPFIIDEFDKNMNHSFNNKRPSFNDVNIFNKFQFKRKAGKPIYPKVFQVHPYD